MKAALSRRSGPSVLTALWVVLLTAGSATAQQLTPEIVKTLDQLAESAAAYKASVPNFTCDEAIRSEASKGGKVRQLVEGTAKFRVLRGSSDDWPTDARTLLTVNGRPVPPNQKPQFPVLLLGGFAKPQELYFNPIHRGCFRYAASTNRLDFEAVSNSLDLEACREIAPATRGFALLDPKTGAVTHLERTVPDEIAAAGHYAAFVALDYTPLSMNGKSYRLPAAIRATQHYSGQDLTFAAQYSHCQLYTGTSRILDVTPADPQP